MIEMRSVGRQRIWASLPIAQVTVRCWFHTSNVWFKRVVQTCGANVWFKRVVGANPCISLAQPPNPHIAALCTARQWTMDCCRTPQVHSNASVQHSTGLFCRARPKVTPKTQNNSLKKVEPCHISYLKHVCQSYGMINRLWGPLAFCISTFYLFVFSQMQYFD